MVLALASAMMAVSIVVLPALGVNLAQGTSQSGDLHYRVALRALEDGNLDVARSELELAAAATPNNPLVWFNLAVVASKQGALEVAKDALDRADVLGIPPPQRDAASALRVDVTYGLLKRQSNPRIILRPTMAVVRGPDGTEPLRLNRTELFKQVAGVFSKAGAQVQLMREMDLSRMPKIAQLFECERNDVGVCVHAPEAELARELKTQGFDAIVELDFVVIFEWEQRTNREYPVGVHSLVRTRIYRDTAKLVFLDEYTQALFNDAPVFVQRYGSDYSRVYRELLKGVEPHARTVLNRTKN